MKKIAVLLNDVSEAAPPESCAKAAVYESDGQSWRVSKEIPVHFDFTESMALIRRDLQSFAQELDGCGIIAGSSFSGLPFQVFDRLRFSVFEVSEISDAALSAIAADADASEEPSGSAGPIETDVPGVFLCDLIALQKQRPEVSSKMALQPFLNDRPYVRLDVICRHMPPWIEKMAREKRIRVAAEQLAGEAFKLYITKYS